MHFTNLFSFALTIILLLIIVILTVLGQVNLKEEQWLHLESAWDDCIGYLRENNLPDSIQAAQDNIDLPPPLWIDVEYTESVGKGSINGEEIKTESRNNFLTECDYVLFYISAFADKQNGESGIGVYFGENNKLNVSEIVSETQTVRAKIIACTKALAILAENGFKKVKICTNDLILQHCLRLDCLRKWRQNGGMKTKKIRKINGDCKENDNQVKNWDLYEKAAMYGTAFDDIEGKLIEENMKNLEMLEAERLALQAFFQYSDVNTLLI